MGHLPVHVYLFTTVIFTPSLVWHAQITWYSWSQRDFKANIKQYGLPCALINGITTFKILMPIRRQYCNIFHSCL